MGEEVNLKKIVEKKLKLLNRKIFVYNLTHTYVTYCYLVTQINIVICLFIYIISHLSK